MNTKLFGFIASILLLGASPAIASPITYTLEGASGDFGGYSGSLTGTFTFDPSTDTLDSVDIAFSSPCPFCGATFLFPVSATANSITAVWPTYDNQLTLSFASDLGQADDDISGGVIIHDPENSNIIFSGTATGEADPSATPIPPSAALFASVLGILGFLGYWRKRRISTDLRVGLCLRG